MKNFPQQFCVINRIRSLHLRSLAEITLHVHKNIYNIFFFHKQPKAKQSTEVAKECLNFLNKRGPLIFISQSRNNTGLEFRVIFLCVYKKLLWLNWTTYEIISFTGFRMFKFLIIVIFILYYFYLSMEGHIIRWRLY